MMNLQPEENKTSKALCTQLVRVSPLEMSLAFLFFFFQNEKVVVPVSRLLGLN